MFGIPTQMFGIPPSMFNRTVVSLCILTHRWANWIPAGRVWGAVLQTGCHGNPRLLWVLRALDG